MFTVSWLPAIIPEYDFIWKWMRQMSLRIKFEAKFREQKIDEKADWVMLVWLKKYKKLWTMPSQ